MSREAHEQGGAAIRARVAILTLSDTRTLETDKSGDTIRDLFEAAGHLVSDRVLIRDEPVELRTQLERWLDRPDVDVILTNGGTGISRRDQTIPIIESLIAIPLPGFGELFRMLSHAEIGSAAMLSRAVAGVTKQHKFLVALPGSTAAVRLATTQLLLPQLGHILFELRK